MNQALQRQIYSQDDIPDHQRNGVVEHYMSSWGHPPTQPDLLEIVREQRRLQTVGRPIPFQERPAPKRISSRIAEAIQSSRYILALKDDWDEEGSKNYEETTWSRSVNWVKEAALTFRKQRGLWVEPPRILPGPEGSIDIHWKTAKRELLINVPENLQEPADYYGCGDPKDTLKGKLDTSLSNEWILVWLMK